MGKRDNYLDYIRAFAALLVFFHHKDKLPGGSIGISIFFCLSGYLITRILIGLPSHSPANLAKFIFRRWARIYPLYAACLGITYLLLREFKPELLDVFQGGLAGMLTLQEIPAWTGYAAAVGWTLHAEAGFYVFFPILFALTWRRGLLPAAIAVSIVVSIGAKIFAGHGDYEHWPIASDMWRTVIYLDQLMFGVICALLISSRPAIVRLFRSGWFFWIPLIINSAMARLVVHSGFDATWYISTSLAAGLCALAILHSAARPTAFPDGLIAWVGRISFSIYLVHAIVIDFIPIREYVPTLNTPLSLAITLAISYLTYRLIELPGIALAKRVARFQPYLLATEASYVPLRRILNAKR